MPDQTRSIELAVKYGESYAFANRVISGSHLVLSFGIGIAVVQVVLGIVVAVKMSLGAEINFYAVLALLTSSAITGFSYYAASLIIGALGVNLKVNLDNTVNTSPFLDEPDRTNLLFSPSSYTKQG